MLTILEYLWVSNPKIVLQLIEKNNISKKVVASYMDRKIRTEIRPSYASLMGHSRWRRVRGGAIRQVSYCEE